MFPRVEYHKKPLNHLRGILIARSVLVVQHRELHANVEPPPRPDAPLAHNIVDYLSDQRFNQPFDEIFMTMDYLQKIGRPDTIAIAENLGRQVGHLM